jgi:hypothetical protein
MFCWVWRGHIRSPFVTGRLGRVQAACVRLPPITPVSGRVKPADFGAVESVTCWVRFRKVFGRGLKSPTGRADANAQLLGDDLPRGAGGSEAGYLAGVDGDWRIAGAMGVFGADPGRVAEAWMIRTSKAVKESHHDGSGL